MTAFSTTKKTARREPSGVDRNSPPLLSGVDGCGRPILAAVSPRPELLPKGAEPAILTAVQFAHPFAHVGLDQFLRLVDRGYDVDRLAVSLVILRDHNRQAKVRNGLKRNRKAVEAF